MRNPAFELPRYMIKSSNRNVFGERKGEVWEFDMGMTERSEGRVSHAKDGWEGRIKKDKDKKSKTKTKTKTAADIS